MNIMLKGFLIGAGIAVVLVFFEYSAIKREIAERSKRLAKKVDWDSNQVSRMRGMCTFGAALPFAFAVGAWWIS
jgi:sterol desaturase/sphingolipid hydroxylase (fatty acid hydroxylase superfamily)